MGASTGFVGRGRELSRLQAAVAGDVRLLLVVGDAGVGKTRLVREGMRRIAGEMTWVAGSCLPLAEMLPLLPVAEALGDFARLDGGGVLEAALDIAPPYVRVEASRLLPQLARGQSTGGRGEGWQTEHLFCAVAELLCAAARQRRLGVLIEDVHWADGATLDLLTFVARADRASRVKIVVTCRSDEVPLDPLAAGWLAHIRGRAEVEELRLGPLSRREVGELVAALAGGAAPPRFVDELYARAQGNPFFTEQLVAAATTGHAAGGLSPSAGLPARLADLLAARASRCLGDASAVLDALAVAGRPLDEIMLCSVTGLNADAVRQGLRELAAAGLLADTAPDGAHQPRHALLSEAVAGALLPGERALLHERTARALEAADGETLAAEAAGHWAAAGRPADELPARLAAADAAERVFCFVEAAAHWQRAIELCEALPGAASRLGVDLPYLYVRAIDALHWGERERAGELAEDAYCRFADHPDPGTAAVIHLRAAMFREYHTPAAAKPVMERALQLFECCPLSADKAEAWWRYATFFLFHAEGRLEASRAVLIRALEVAEAAGAAALTARILSSHAATALLQGRVDEGLSLLEQGSVLAGTRGDDLAGLWLAATGTDALLRLGRFQDAAELGRRGLHAARQAGIHSCLPAIHLAANTADALLALGRTAEAAALIDPLTAESPRREHWDGHERRAEIDLLRGEIEAATRRQQQIRSFSFAGSIDNSRRLAQDAAELALWTARSGDALEEVQRALALFQVPDLTILCGRLLGAGMRACADLAERARARCDHNARDAALAAAGELVSWADQMGGAPFTDHPYLATIPAERAGWHAERTRVAGDSDPAAWSSAAKAWESLGCPHRAGYAWWRHVEAHLAAGQPPAAATAAVRAAAAAADGHAPLQARIRALSQRARIPLPADPAAARPAEPPVPYGLTGRELAVLRLLADGRTNNQIGAELFISPKTAGVHVTNILRKLRVSGRVQAAALAERAGLLDSDQP